LKCACGAALAGAADLGVAASRQVIDIPLETATVTQQELHEVACDCSRLRSRRTQPASSALGRR
jgi:transposase